MKSPYGLELNEGCKTCKANAGGYFCQFSPGVMKDFDAIKSTAFYPKRSLLFIEGQDPRGSFVLCQGQAKLSITSNEGKTLIMRVAKSGEILGLIAILSGRPYELTAETLRPCQAAFVHREDFLRFVAKHPEASQNMIRQLSAQYQGACEQLRTVALSSSAQEKLARLLLAWSAGIQATKEGIRINLPMTHGEIAEFIGTTRETVTRTLSDFKTRQLVAIQGSILTIPSRAALESSVGV